MITLDRYLVRPMTSADISQVADIEHESFPTTWPRTAYRRELANKMASYLVVVDRSRPPVAPPRSTQRPIVARILNRSRPEEPPTTDYIAGYVGLWFMVDEAHIVAIAVREAYRGRGLGELLLAEALDLSLAREQQVVTLEVRRTNLVAQKLYEKYRFLRVGVRKRYYSDNHEDALIMSTPPIQADVYREFLAYRRAEWEKRATACGDQ